MKPSILLHGSRTAPNHVHQKYNSQNGCEQWTRLYFTILSTIGYGTDKIATKCYPKNWTLKQDEYSSCLIRHNPKEGKIEKYRKARITFDQSTWERQKWKRYRVQGPRTDENNCPFSRKCYMKSVGSKQWYHRTHWNRFRHLIKAKITKST